MSVQSPKSKEKEEIDHKEIRAMPLLDAVEYAFSLPPSRGAIILGPPGIGKTENVIKYAELEAKKLGKNLVVLNEARATMTHEEYLNLIKDIIKNPSQYYVVTVVPFGAVMPDDLLGVPNIVTVKENNKVLGVFEESALKASLSLLTVRDIHGALIIDDALNAFDNVRRSFIQAVFQQRLVGGFNGVKLSPNVRVIATGNLSSESELSTPLQKPMVGRAWIAYTTAESLESWYKRMEEATDGKWFKEIYAFLLRYPKYYNDTSLIDEEIPTGPVPRSWTAMAEDFEVNKSKIVKLIKEDPNKAVKIVSAYVGVEAAMQFVAFMSKPVPSVNEVLSNPELLKNISSDMDLAFRFGIHLSQKIEEVIREKKVDPYPYVRLITELMKLTTDDIGVFIYEVMTEEGKKKIKNITREWMTSGDEKKKEVAKKIRELLVGMAVADVLLDR